MNAHFMDSLRVAIGIANHAPSSHNCQPWALGYLGSRQVKDRVFDGLKGGCSGIARLKGREDVHVLCLALNRKRALKALPAHDLEMKLSCGLFLQPLLQALGMVGWSVREVMYAGEDTPLEVSSPQWPEYLVPLAYVFLEPLPGPCRSEEGNSLSRLKEVMVERCTNRGPFEDGAISEGVRHRLQRCGTSIKTCKGQGVNVRFHTDPALIVKAGQLVSNHGGRDFSHGAAWRETYSYIQFSRRRATRAEDGFSIEQLFGDMAWEKRVLLKLVLSPLSMKFLKQFGFHRYIAKSMGALVAGAGTLVSLSFSGTEATAADEIKAGCVLSDVWLQAYREGLSVHPLSVMLQHSDVRDELQALLGVSGRLFFFGRIGHPVQAFRPSARRNSDREVLHAL